MTRGRKKDLTIPPTRALTQQRDYRARKAKYIMELEERCRRAEEENAQLRMDLELARAGLAVPAAFSPEVTQISTELMRSLTQASASLARFQQLVFAIAPPTSGPSPPSNQVQSISSTQLPEAHNNIRPALFPSPTPSPTVSELDHPRYTHPSERLPRIQHSPSRKLPSPRHLDRYDSLQPEGSSSRSSSRSPTPESECCGGIMDCRELIERTEERDLGVTLPPLRLSVLRNTSEHRDPPRYSSHPYHSRSNGSETSIR